MRTLLSALLACAGASGVAGQQEPSLSFVVLGHLRGDPVGDTMRSPLLGEIVADCARLKPDLVLLSGDNIWGDYGNVPADPAVVAEEWEVLDRALSALGVPIHRVPGNHDISDLATRDVYFDRYGKVPRAVQVNKVLFLLLSTAWIPADGDTSQARHVHGVPLDRAQLEFATRMLEEGTHEHAFVVVHHLHWWQQDAVWWNSAHPRFVGKKVRAVIGGDYGPTKYSHKVVDDITYVHAAVASEPGLEMLRMNEEARQLNQQLDAYLHFTIRGANVEFELRPVGTRDRKHTPERWDEVNQLDASDYVYYSTWATTPRRWKLTLLVLAAGFSAGAGFVLVTWCLWSRRRR